MANRKDTLKRVQMAHMLNEGTIFILGAGASVPYGFPSGETLKTLIIEALSDPSETASGTHILENTEFSTEDLIKAADDFRNSGRQSIDAFLSDQNRIDLRLIGKYAIASILIPFERPESLTPNQNDWLRWLIDEVCGDRGFFDWPLDDIQFWTFNYDRTVEQILFETLRARYPGPNHGGPTDQAIYNVVESKVYHLHGCLEKLGINDIEGRRFEPVLPFDEKFRNTAESIWLLYELSNKHQNWLQRNEVLRAKRRVIFLGFGYHEEIMARYKPGLQEVIEKFGTGYGLMTMRREPVYRALSGGVHIFGEGTDFNQQCMYKMRLGSKEQDCLSFLKEHFES